MTKQEVVETVAERCGLSKAAADRAVNAILDSLTEAMVDGEEVSFAGFGKFLSQRRRARVGVNPQDPSKKIRIRAANVPKFRPGSSLRAAVSDLSAAAGDGEDTASSPGDSASSVRRSGPAEWKPLAERR